MSLTRLTGIAGGEGNYNYLNLDAYLILNKRNTIQSSYNHHIHAKTETVEQEGHSLKGLGPKC